MTNNNVREKISELLNTPNTNHQIKSKESMEEKDQYQCPVCRFRSVEREEMLDHVETEASEKQDDLDFLQDYLDELEEK